MGGSGGAVGRARLLLLLALIPASLGAEENREREYVWPLAYRGCLTSSFAEYRQGHFHAGIDLSTNGKTGYKVRAVADGEVYRIRTSPYGYGKSIYLAFPDGRIAVYAHLSDFAPHLREMVEREQERIGRYEVEIRLPAGSAPVSAGEVIGYSGQTGIGAPHLHFELRDGENVPLNPVLHGFPISDEEPPVIRSVLLSPLENDARVEGSIRPLPLDMVWSDTEGCYRTERVVRVEGPVGVMISCDDGQSGCSRRKLGVYSFDLRVDDELTYRSRFDSFTYDVASLVGIEFDLGMIERGGGRFHRLYSTAPNLLPFTLIDRTHTGVIVGAGRNEYGDGVVLAEGLHHLEASVGDANGNYSRAVIAVVVGGPPEIRRASFAGDDEVTVFVEGSPSRIGDFVVSRSLNGGRHWESRPATYAAGKDAWVTEGFTRLQEERKPLLYRIELSTVEGVQRRPYFVFRNYEGLPTPEPAMTLDIEYHAGTALLNLGVDRVFPYEVEARVIRDGKSPLRPPMVQAGPNHYEGILPLDQLDSEPAWVEVTLSGRDGMEWSTLKEIRTMRVSAARGGEVTDKSGRASIRFDRSGLVRDTHFRIEEEEGPPLERGLSYASPVYRFEPADALLRGDAVISIKPSAGADAGKRVALYRLDTHGRWQFVTRRVDPAAPTVDVSTHSLSRYALIRDEAVPAIFGVYPADGATVRTLRPRLQAKVTDVGAGFESEDLQIHLDGKRMIAEWDPEREILTYSLRAPLRPGSHKMIVYAVDRAGNSAKSESVFYVSGEAGR